MTNKPTRPNAFKLVAAKKTNAPIKMGPELPRRNYSRGRGARVFHLTIKKKVAAPMYWVRLLHKYYSKWRTHPHYSKPVSKTIQGAAPTTKQPLKRSCRAFFAFSSCHTARLYQRHVWQLTYTALRQRSKDTLREVAQHSVFSAPVNSRRAPFMHLTVAKQPFRAPFCRRKRKIFKWRLPILFSRKSFTYYKYRPPSTPTTPKSAYLALRAAIRGVRRTHRRKHYLQNQRLWKNFCAGPKRQVRQLARSINDVLELKKGPAKLRRRPLLPRKRFVAKRVRGKHLARFSLLQIGLRRCSRRQGRARRNQLLQQRSQFYRGQCRSTLKGPSTLPFYVVCRGARLSRFFGIAPRYKLLHSRARHAIAAVTGAPSRRSVPPRYVGVFRRARTRSASANQRLFRARYVRRALLDCIRWATTPSSRGWKREARRLHRGGRYHWALASCTQKKEYSKLKTFRKQLRFFRPVIKYRREIKWQLKWAARRQNKIYRAFCRANHRAWYGRRACKRLLLSPATAPRRKARRKAERQRHQKAHWWPEAHKKEVLRAMQRAERQKARDKGPIEALPETLLFVADRLARRFKSTNYVDAYVGHKRRCRWKFNRLFLNVHPRTRLSGLSTRGCYQRHYFRLATNIRRPRRFLRRRFAYAASTTCSGAQRLFRSRLAMLNNTPPLFVAANGHLLKRCPTSTAVVKSTVLAPFPYFSGAPISFLAYNPPVVGAKGPAAHPTERSGTSKKKFNLSVSTTSIKPLASESILQPSFQNAKFSWSKFVDHKKYS